MDEQLQKLVAELRQESCPPAVLERVSRRIAAEQAQARARSGSNRNFVWSLTNWWSRFRRQSPALAFAACAVLIILGVLGGRLALLPRGQQTHSAVQLAPQVDPAILAAADRALVARQAGAALVLVGQAFLHAAAHSEKTLLQEALPPLRQSLQTAQEKVTNRL